VTADGLTLDEPLSDDELLPEDVPLSDELPLSDEELSHQSSEEPLDDESLLCCELEPDEVAVELVLVCFVADAASAGSFPSIICT